MIESETLVFDAGPPMPIDDRVTRAVVRAGSRFVVVRDRDEAVTLLSGDSVPAVTVVDAAAPGAAHVLRAVRGNAHLHSMPVVVLVPDASTASFEEAFLLGADSVVVADRDRELTTVLRALAATREHSHAAAVHGVVLVAHPDAARRRALARGLRRFGFGVTFAIDRDDVLEKLDCSPRGILVSDELLGEDSGGPSRLRGIGVPTVVLAPARRHPALRAWCADAGISVASEHGTIASLVFRLGELFRPDMREARTSRRVLWSTLCRFRPAGTPEPRHGLSYNVSAEGIYIRAVAAPAAGSELWIELAPPGTERLVHLCGEVVWRRGIAPATAGGPAPAGFGVRFHLEACARGDTEAYRAGYEWLAARAQAEEALPEVAQNDAA